MSDHRNNGTNTDERNSDGTFAAGNSGRPKGARHKVTRAVEALLEGQAEELTQSAIDAALSGDTVALRLCLERIAPARKDTPVQFDLPPMSSPDDAAMAAQSVLQAVAEGNVTLLEGATLMGLIDSYRRTLELTEIEQRISALETANE
ncbi:MAG: DUF5681 domain-containing protein [Pseudomonadota bacterium]